MSCRDVQDLLSAYVDGELGRLSASRVARHVAGCPSCAKEIAEIQSLGERLASWRDAAAPAHLKQTLQSQIGHRSVVQQRAIREPGRPLAWVAGAVVVAVVAIAAFLVLPKSASADVEKMQAAVAQVRSCHMVCKWPPKRGSGPMYVGREVWFEKGDWRVMDLYAGNEIDRGGKAFSFDYKTRALKPKSGGMGAAPTLLKLCGPSLVLKADSAKPLGTEIIGGKTCRKFAITDPEDDSRQALFLVDASTYRPVEIVERESRDGSWIVHAEMRFEYDQPPKGSLFDPDSLKFMPHAPPA